MPERFGLPCLMQSVGRFLEKSNSPGKTPFFYGPPMQSRIGRDFIDAQPRCSTNHWNSMRVFRALGGRVGVEKVALGPQ